MRKMIRGIAAVLAVSALMAGQAFAVEKLAVKNALGTASVFSVDENGGVIVNGGLFWDAINKRLGLFTSTPAASLHVVETSGTNATRGFLSAQHNDGAQAAYLLFRKSRGTDIGPTIVASGDYAGFADAQAYDGFNYLNAAGFGFIVDKIPTTGTNTGLVTDATYPGKTPMSFVVLTGYKQGQAPVGNARAERLRVNSDGNVGIGTSTPTSKLQVVGLPVYADNATAIAGGLTAGAFYRTSTGVLMVVF